MDRTAPLHESGGESEDNSDVDYGDVYDDAPEPFDCDFHEEVWDILGDLDDVNA